jgi:diguanylate cyclase (GGDEF)-like protein
VVGTLGVEIVNHPWHRAVRTRTSVTGVVVEVTQVDGSATRRAVVNASPVLDAKGAVRGCLVSFNDITELDRVNADLRAAMDELQLSKARIEMQNEELRRLASIDSMTTCLNRRAFMTEADTLFAAARNGSPLACIMADIDKFKLVNDTYGHAVGDEVIIQVARIFMLGLSPGDLLCRYGGEEFCILLPGLDLAQAAAVAERLREKVETQAGPGIRSIAGLRVTSSFGVSELSLGATTLPQLIEEADQALYASKQAGRNFVSLFTETPWLSSAVDSTSTRANADAALAMDEMVILEAGDDAPRAAAR